MTQFLEQRVQGSRRYWVVLFTPCQTIPQHLMDIPMAAPIVGYQAWPVQASYVLSGYQHIRWQRSQLDYHHESKVHLELSQFLLSSCHVTHFASVHA